HLADEPVVRRHAALNFAPHGALSHTDALETWGLPCETSSAAVEGPSTVHEEGRPAVHMTVSAERSATSVSGLVLHRRKGFSVGAPLTVVRKDLTVVRLEQAIVESWPLLDPVCRRAPAIVAVRERRTTAGRLLSALESNRNAAGTAEMRALI